MAANQLQRFLERNPQRPLHRGDPVAAVRAALAAEHGARVGVDQAEPVGPAATRARVVLAVEAFSRQPAHSIEDLRPASGRLDLQ